MYATWCPITSCPSSSSRSCSRWSGTASVFMALATTPRCVSFKKIINFCARVVSGRRKFDHISDIVERLGWLNAKSLVQYHTACSLLKTLRTGAPAYVARTIGPPRNAVHNHATRRFIAFHRSSCSDAFIDYTHSYSVGSLLITHSLWMLDDVAAFYLGRVCRCSVQHLRGCHQSW